MEEIKSKDAFKALMNNAGSSSKKAGKFLGGYLKQVGKAFATNPNKTETKEEEKKDDV